MLYWDCKADEMPSSILKIGKPSWVTSLAKLGSAICWPLVWNQLYCASVVGPCQPG